MARSADVVAALDVERSRAAVERAGERSLIVALADARSQEVEKLPIDTINPRTLRGESDAQLLSVHLRLHQLFAQHFAGNGKLAVGGLRREDLVNAELFVQDDMVRRGMAHQADDELATEAAALRRARNRSEKALPKAGLIISPRWMAEAIVAGRKTLIAKTREWGIGGRDFVLLSEREALGTVRVGEPRSVNSRGALLALKSETLIDGKVLREFCDEQKSWCEGPWIIYPVEVLDRFEPPRSTDAPLGPQAVVREVTIKSRFAEINPGSSGRHAGIDLEEVLAHYDRPIALRMPAVFLVGSLCNHGKSANDIDVLIRGPLDEQTRRVVEFRLGRALPPRLSRRVSFLDDELGGPFTHHVPLYDLMLVPHADRSVVEMSEGETTKQANPLLDLPPKGSGPRPAIFQYHFRGRSLHGDLRLQVDDFLVGWTLAIQRAGAVPDVNTVEEGRRIASGFSVDGDRFVKPMRAPAKLFATPKSRQPLDWLRIKGKVFEPGEVGATAEEQGVMVVADEPRVEFGLQKAFSHEYFLSKGRKLAGVLFFRLLQGMRGKAEGKSFWTAWLSKELLPSVLKRRAVATKTMPPDGYSALPVSLERVVPKGLRYWEKRGTAAREARDALVDERIFKPSDLKLVSGEIRLTTEKRYLYEPIERTYSFDRRPTFAARVAKLLPKGLNSVHPFLSNDWRASLVDHASDERNLLVLSSPGDDQDVAEVIEAVKGSRAEWLVECDDSAEARDIFSEVGRPFRVEGGEGHLLCASFPVRGVEFVDVPFDEDAAKAVRTVRFALSWQFWKGQTVIRATPSRQVWHLLLDDPRGGLRGWRLKADPLAGDRAITALRSDHREKELLTFHGDAAPGEKIGGEVLNDTKNTPSRIEILDSGKAAILDDQRGSFLRIEFEGKRLKGVWHLVAEEVGSDVWQLGRGGEPSRAVPGVEKAHRTIDYHLADGTVLRDVQEWNPARAKETDDKTSDRAMLRPLAIVRPMKPSTAFENAQAAVDAWGTPAALKVGVIVEPKWNGFRVILQRDARGRTLLTTEEVFTRKSKLPNLLAALPSLAEDAKKIKGGAYMIDCEFMAVRGGAVVPRRELAEFRSGKPPESEATVVLRAFRALYADGKNLVEADEAASHEALAPIVSGADLKHVKLTERKLARTVGELRSALEWASKFDGSEGAMLKSAAATYTLGGQTSSWAKLKRQREIRAIVYDRDPVKDSPGVWTFFCAVKPAEGFEASVEVGGEKFVPIGRTFNSSVDAKVGDVLAVDVTELLIDSVKGTVRWFTPTVVDKVSREPMSVADVRALAEAGEIKKGWDGPIRILKTKEERFVFGIVLEPNDGKEGAPFDPDAQEDVYSAEEVRNAAHHFLADHRHIGLMHRAFVDGKAKLLESYLAPVDFEAGGTQIRTGTWLLAIRIVDDALWKAVKSGELTGFSIGGSAIRRPSVS